MKKCLLLDLELYSNQDHFVDSVRSYVDRSLKKLCVFSDQVDLCLLPRSRNKRYSGKNKVLHKEN